MPNQVAHSRRWGKKAIFWGLVLLVIVVVAVWLLRASHQPAQGTITTSSPKAAAPVEYVRQDGQALSFHYQSSYQAKAVQKSTIYTEQYSFSQINSVAVSSKNLSLSVRPLTNIVLGDEAGYKLRKDTPATYQPTTETIDGEKVYIFSKTADGNEVTAFWAHHNTLLTISLSSSYTDVNALHDELLNILNSVQWH